ncbi:MAG: chaperone-like protein [Proteiniphilum sp.]|nr:chaperone-like protein [Proteiniphilum sp.]
MINEETRQAIVAHRLENAHKTLAEIPVLIRHELWNTAVNRLYYACYYSVTALLTSYGIETQTYAGVRRMLAMHFTKTEKLPVRLNKFYSDLFENRQASDYADFVFFDREIVEELYLQSGVFIEAIENLVKK